MQRVFTYFINLFLIRLSGYNSQMDQDYPIGVNLGPSHLTSAYIDANNNSVNVATVTSSQAWNDLFLDTLRTNRSYEEKQNHAKDERVAEIFLSVLRQIRTATEEKLGRRAQLTLISYPEHFKAEPYVSALARIAMKEYPEYTTNYQVRPYLDCIKTAYGLSTSEALGYDPDHDLDDSNSLLIHVDYQQDFIEVSIMAVSKESDIRNRFFRIDNFGGLGTEKSAALEEIGGLMAHLEKLLDEEVLDNKYGQSQPEDFRFIIFSGEVAHSEFQKIREAILKIVPDLPKHFRDEIDPFWVGAIGAAQRAREYAIRPPGELIGYWTQEEWRAMKKEQCGLHQNHGHDEL